MGLIRVTIETDSGEEWRGYQDEETLAILCIMADDLSDKAVTKERKSGKQ